jgi:ApaG protein
LSRETALAFEAVTQGVHVVARPWFMPDRSDPDDNAYFWAYEITIENKSDVTVQLTARRWIITDRAGRVQIVEGAGVVGEQPILRPGDRFVYVSGCPLSTPSGLMHGSYTMVGEGGASFEAEVPAFSLDSPHDRRIVN